MAPPADAVLAFLSGLPLLLLGGAFLLVRPRRAPQLFFGAFAVLWGLQILTANAGRLLGDPALHHGLLLASYGLALPAYLTLTHFAGRMRPGFATRAATFVAALAAAAGALTILLAPELLVARVTWEDGPRTTLGPAALPLVNLPFFGAFYFAVVVLYIAYREATPGTPRHRARGMLLALLLFTVYTTVRQIFLFLNPQVSVASPIGAYGQSALFLLGTVLLAGIAIDLWARPPPPEGRDAPLLLAFALPATTALAEIVFERFDVSMSSLGFWRLATVAALVYALAHHQLFDLDLRLKRLAGPGVAALIAAFGVPLALTLATGDLGLRVVVPMLVVEGIGVGASFLFQDRIREKLFPGVEDKPDYVYQRKLEVYRTSLEDAVARGLPPDAPELRELRVRLGIEDRDVRIVEMLVAPAAARAAAAKSSLVPGAEVLGRYRLVRRLGDGTHGSTWAARDVRARHDVAVKIVGKDVLGGAAAKLLLREARLGAAIAHPNVVAILDVADEPDRVVLVMELAEGGNLEQLIARAGTPSLSTCVTILDGMLSALEEVHARGIVHRNLKPVNLLLAKGGEVKVSDFGAARRDGAEGHSSEEAAAALSILHMSPEQVRGRPLDHRTDLYSAAVLFHSILTDRHYLPIAGKDDYEIRRLIVEAPPQLHLAGQPGWIEPFLLRALAKDPADRFPDAAAMRRALRAADRPASSVAR